MIAVDYSSSTSFNEDAFEQGIIDHLQTSLGYEDRVENVGVRAAP